MKQNEKLQPHPLLLILNSHHERNFLYKHIILQYTYVVKLLCGLYQGKKEKTDYFFFICQLQLIKT